MKSPTLISELNFNSVHDEQRGRCGTMTWSYAQKTGALSRNGSPVATVTAVTVGLNILMNRTGSA